MHDATTGDEYYYLLKELYSIAGLANTNGELIEAYAYDAYGKVHAFASGAVCFDSDDDGDTDLADFADFQACFSGDGTPSTCATTIVNTFDSDGDADIDLTDLAAMVNCMDGPWSSLPANGDFNSNGVVDEGDDEAFTEICYSGEGGGINTSGCRVFDFDADGDVDIYDYGVLVGLMGTFVGQPTHACLSPSATSTVGNPYHFTGRCLDLIAHGEQGEPKQHYYHRARTYDPYNGRFGQHDMLGETQLPHEFGRNGLRVRPTIDLQPEQRQYTDGMNLYQYVRSRPTVLRDPLGLQATQPAVDKSKACCEYDRTHTISGVAGHFSGSYTGRTKHQRTETCGGNLSSPIACCKCPAGTMRRWGQGAASGRESTTWKLVGAKWGACCWCTIYYSRAPGPWYMHAVISMTCTDGTKFLADHSISGGIPYWENRDVDGGAHGRGSGTPPSGFPVVVKKLKTDCTSGKNMIAWVKKQDKRPLPYDWYHDCHWFARGACESAGGGRTPMQ